MREEVVYLTIYQAYALGAKIEEFKQNPYFQDPISESYLSDVDKQAAKIVVAQLYPITRLKQKLTRNGDKVKVQKNKFDYLTRLTGVDVFSEEVMREFMERVSYEEQKLDSQHVKVKK